MHVRKCACALEHQSQFVVKPGVPLGDVVVQVSLLAELHHHPEGAVVVVEVEQTDQVGVFRQTVEQFDLLHRCASILVLLDLDPFDRHFLPRLRLSPAVDDTEAAAAQRVA